MTSTRENEVSEQVTIEMLRELQAKLGAMCLAGQAVSDKYYRLLQEYHAARDTYLDELLASPTPPAAGGEPFQPVYLHPNGPLPDEQQWFRVTGKRTPLESSVTVEKIEPETVAAGGVVVPDDDGAEAESPEYALSYLLRQLSYLRCSEGDSPLYLNSARCLEILRENICVERGRRPPSHIALAFKRLDEMAAHFRSTMPTPLNKPGEACMMPTRHVDIAWDFEQAIRLLRGHVAGLLEVPSKLLVFPHPLEPDEKVANQRIYADGWNACHDAFTAALAAAPQQSAADDEPNELGELTPERCESIAGAVAASWCKSDFKVRAKRDKLAAACIRELSSRLFSEPQQAEGGWPTVDDAMVEAARSAILEDPRFAGGGLTPDAMRVALQAALPLPPGEGVR